MLFEKGVSHYADSTWDGAESIAEGFVRIRNGEYVSDKLKKHIEKHIERWLK